MTDKLFSPGFGNKPRTLVGRMQDLRILTDGLHTLPGNRERARLIIGQQGLGKTVLLLEIAEHARQHDYIVASPTVSSNDMLVRILEKLEKDGSKYLNQKRTKITGGTVGFCGSSANIQTESGQKQNRSFAFLLTEICEKAAEIEKGILILIDDVQATNKDLKKLIITYQELVGEGHNIAVVFAGLPAAISTILSEHDLAFFNRASKLYLEPISFNDISVYYRNCFDQIGLQISSEWIDLAAHETEGSPYLMQLIGHYITISANDNGTLPEDRFQKAISLAKKDFINDICETTLSVLSEKDIEFLKAMSKDENESFVKDIASRLGVDSPYTQRYKSRLIQAGIITQKKRGIVEFAVPYLRDYLCSDQN